MEKLKRYDIDECGEYWESEDGSWCLADEVDAREEARKMSIEELRAQFEKDAICFDNRKDDNGDYINNDIFNAFFFYKLCAKENELLKEGE